MLLLLVNDHCCTIVKCRALNAALLVQILVLRRNSVVVHSYVVPLPHHSVFR